MGCCENYWFFNGLIWAAVIFTVVSLFSYGRLWNLVSFHCFDMGQYRYARFHLWWVFSLIKRDAVAVFIWNGVMLVPVWFFDKFTGFSVMKLTYAQFCFICICIVEFSYLCGVSFEFSFTRNDWLPVLLYLCYLCCTVTVVVLGYGDCRGLFLSHGRR